eukprot:c17129_g1_i1.p2 GENE.c17129_g1_i1~~c17129_g1_i1.p2  ORF type:complete len:278 (-),score=63.80 c17129_g1_i1:256-1089(-)
MHQKGELPFDGHRAQMFLDIQSARHAPFPKHVPKPAREFIKLILNPDAKSRPTLSDLQNHPYFLSCQNGTIPESPRNRRASQRIMQSLGKGLNKLLLSTTNLSPRNSPKSSPKNSPRGPVVEKRGSVPTKAQATPPFMNVFELIVIGLCLDIVTTLDQPPAPTPQNSGRSLNTRRFVTTKHPSTVLVDLANAMEPQRNVHKIRIVHATFKIKGEISDDMEVPIKFTTRVIQMLPPSIGLEGLYMVETTKLQGSTAKFDSFCRGFMGSPTVMRMINRK